MDTTLSVSFYKKHTSEFDKVLGYAKQFNSFSPAKDSSSCNVIVIENTELIERYDVLKKLLKFLENSKSAVVKLGNREFSPKVFIYESKSVIECGFGYSESEDKNSYCNISGDECWGCRFLSEPVLDFTAQPYYKYSKYWYSYGSFSSIDKWEINKKELLKALQTIIEYQFLYLCPYFKDKYIKKTLDSLPDEIDVSDRKKWGVIYSDQVCSDSNSQDAINIHHRDVMYGFWKSGNQESKEKKVLTKLDLLTQTEVSHRGRFVPDTTFKDIGGLDDVVKTIREVIVLPIKLPSLYKHLGIVRNKGILLCGESGNDKEMLAKSVANDIGAHFISVKGPEILVNWSDPELKFKSIVQDATELQPSIIFLDEFDCIAQVKSGYSNEKIETRVINQLLTFMDNLADNCSITVIAAAAKPDTWDALLFRQGRLDYQIQIKTPSLAGCLQLLKLETKDMPLADDVDLNYVAEKLLGFCRADIRALVKDAAIAALRRSIDIDTAISDNRDQGNFSILMVNQYDFVKAIGERKSRR